MATSPTVPLPRGCSCQPDPEQLPVALLAATIDDPKISPSLLALTVDYEAQVWRAGALAKHLLDWVLDFALRREERAILSAGRAIEAARRAVRATFGNGRDRGVPGEILLHAVCRQHFGSDTVISKVWFKTAVNDTYKGFDVVHCVHMAEELELWLGEAKFYQDLGKALRSVLSDLKEHLKQDYLRSEFALIADKIGDSHPHAEELRRLMHPNTSLDVVFDRIVVPALVAYDSDVTCAHDRISTQYREDLEVEVRRAWVKFKNGLDSSLPVTIRLFLIPMATKQKLLDALDTELIAWR
jgi:HamA